MSTQDSSTLISLSVSFLSRKKINKKEHRYDIGRTSRVDYSVSITGSFLAELAEYRWKKTAWRIPLSTKTINIEIRSIPSVFPCHSIRSFGSFYTKTSPSRDHLVRNQPSCTQSVFVSLN